MNIIGQQFVQLRAREVGLAFGDVKFRELIACASVGVLFPDFFPDAEGGVRFAKGTERLSVGHHGVAVVVFGIFLADLLEQRACFGGTFQAQQALTQVRPNVDVLGVALDRGAVTLLGLLQFAALKIDIAELKVVMRFVEVMDLRLQFLDAAAVVGAWQFKAASRGGTVAIVVNEIPDRAEPGDENQDGPKIFAAADGIDSHPNDERTEDQSRWRGEPAREPIPNFNQAKGHAPENKHVPAEKATARGEKSTA